MAKMIHSMIRVLEETRSLEFYRTALGLEEAERFDFPEFTLIYLRDPASSFELELTINKGQSAPYDLGNGYGHLAVAVDDLEATLQQVEQAGASPGQIRELKHGGAVLGRFFFVKDPDGYSIEILQRGGRFG